MVHVTETEGMVASFSEHSTFVGGVDTSIVVVDKRPDTDPGWAAQIHIANGLVGEHSRHQERRIKLYKRLSLMIDFENTAQTTLVERQPILGVVAVVLLC